MIGFNPRIILLIIGIPVLYALTMMIFQIVRYFVRKSGNDASNDQLSDEDPEDEA
ncbi:MAG: hypothetical protein ACO1N0_18975 [Fluviicola sp.]